ncbi:MAG TPA: DUF3619 family protein [Pseudomonadales bacterium]|nr:DUF3619 family protein [Pseudomonadales bacterium]
MAIDTTRTIPMTEEEFNNKAKHLLDENVDRLDAATLAKLHQARNRALEHAGKRSGFPAYSGWMGAGAMAASLAVGVVYFDQQPPPLPAIYEDALQQAAAEEIELMDDLDFVAWLVLEEDDLNHVDSST